MFWELEPNAELWPMMIGDEINARMGQRLRDPHL